MENELKKPWYVRHGIAPEMTDTRVATYFWIFLPLAGIGSIICWYVAMKRLWKRGNKKIVYFCTSSVAFFLILMLFLDSLQPSIFLIGALLFVTAILLPILKLGLIPNSKSGRITR